MSLFKTRTFWGTRSDAEDECFDHNSLLITKLSSDSDLIVTGSHSGVVRIFKPSCDLNENNNLEEYKATDLLIETILKDPIIQVDCGRLVSGSSKLQLAILQPKLISVYAFITKEGATDHGVQNDLQLAYEHKLRRLAYNLCVGPFGGSQNRDFICVQSLDGLLTFYEQESFAFCCFLPEFLLPGCLSYVRRSDSFVTCTSSWNITSFKYKLLSEAGGESEENADEGARVPVDWKYNLGESALDIDVVEDVGPKETYIVVLGEKNLFCLNESGKLKYMKRLEFPPVCFTNYSLNDRIMSLVVSETNNLLIYQNTSLKWCAQLTFSPVCVERAFLGKISGVLVLLSEEGRLECAYLGTEPNLFVAPPLTVQELDFEQTGRELANLNKILKHSYSNDLKIKNTTDREIVVNVGVNEQSELVDIEIIPRTFLEEVQIVVSTFASITVEPRVGFFSKLSEKASMSCRVSCDSSNEVASLVLEVVASYISNLGVARIVSTSASLPLNLAADICPPVKDSEYKVTLNINQTPVGLSALFPEYGLDSNAAAFKNPRGGVVTILLAKSSERYRLQSDSFASLALFIEQMVFRLKKQHTNDFSISFNSALPIGEPLLYINRHFNSRQKVVALQEQLTQLTSQFRLIQKRLVAKFKVKNPTPLANLERLLDDTFAEIVKVCTELQEANDALSKSQNDLACVMHVLLNLISLMDGSFETIDSALNPSIQDIDGQSWEDVFDAGLCFLLRTMLAKSDKDRLRAAHTSFEDVKDVSKLEKHFSQVLERIRKGSSLDTANLRTETSELVDGGGEETIPIGSQIAQSSSKSGLLRKRQRVVS